MKRLLMSAGIVLSAALSATPALAQESLFSVEKPSKPVALAPLDANDARTPKFAAAWEDFKNAVFARDAAKITQWLAPDRAAMPVKQLENTLFFLTKAESNAFSKMRVYASISSRTFPSKTLVLGWEPPASFSAQDRAVIASQPGGEAIGCYGIGPKINRDAIKTAADTRNDLANDFACARMIMATDGAIRFEVDMPSGYSIP